jgi:hypothetical protein
MTDQHYWTWPGCGTTWNLNSTALPGSSCDIGECLCAACEDGADCAFHETGRYARPPIQPDRRPNAL